MKRNLSILICLGMVVGSASIAGGDSFEQTISREHPEFDCYMSELFAGRDGMVYMISTRNQPRACTLRMSPEGKDKTVSFVVDGANGLAVNADGVIGVTKAKWGGGFFVYRKDFQRIADFTDFPGNGWDSPFDVTAGAGGDFYVPDINRDRVVRFNPSGKVVQSYAIPREPAGDNGRIIRLLVCERTRCLYPITRSGLRCVGFDGRKRWEYEGVKYSEGNWGGLTGGADVDDAGTLPEHSTLLSLAGTR